MRRLSVLAALLVVTLAPAPVRAAPVVPPVVPPFVLPFADAPSAGGWLLGQLYGNTTGAYRFGDLWYKAGQGLHFGLDFTAPCGTPIVSIGNGEVVQADWTARGSGPHNLVVRHPGEGVTVLYGHLLRRPDLAPGERVSKGQVVGASGDPDGTCEGRPHLHLEIRSLDYRTAYNPLDWIKADWAGLMLMGPFSDLNFVRNRDAPLKWVQPDDQPKVQFGGAPLNAFPNAWPQRDGDAACVVTSC